MSDFTRFEMQDKYPNADDQPRSFSCSFSWDAFYNDQPRQYGTSKTSRSMLVIDDTRQNSPIQVARSLSVLGLSQAEEESIASKLWSLSRGEIPAPDAGWWNRATNAIIGRGTSRHFHNPAKLFKSIIPRHQTCKSDTRSRSKTEEPQMKRGADVRDRSTVSRFVGSYTERM
ncbi:uncharacterized protein L199_004313 [Kwoniella botswanensis]|uniref:uncharacterized protein n=1 Tax=Kwoniella botswanensis TaxID=1268659 RepID=UPI00315CC4C6